MLKTMQTLATKWHQGQFRKGKLAQVPYIVHPAAVVNRLISWGEPLDSSLLDVAWGHDLREDTKVTRKEMMQISSPEVLASIEVLTKGKTEFKPDYIRRVAACGDRAVLLVKIADRLSNSYDFLLWEGKQRAYVYLHEADAVHEALLKLPQDEVTANALKEWEILDLALKHGVGEN